MNDFFNFTREIKKFLLIYQIIISSSFENVNCLKFMGKKGKHI